jgi:CheY-like chemotaxis protein
VRLTVRKGTSAPRILVVEDDDAIRALLLDLLRDAGYTPSEARNGREGLERVAHDDPDLILLDKLMPVVDGTAFAQQYHAQPGSHAPIVALCAIREAAEWSAQIGAVAVVTKPFNIDDLLATVRAKLPKAGRA